MPLESRLARSGVLTVNLKKIGGKLYSKNQKKLPRDGVDCSTVLVLFPAKHLVRSPWS